MKMSKKIAIAASALLISSCIGFSVSAQISDSGSCKKTTTSYTDVLTTYTDYAKSASLSVGYYYKDTGKADMLCTYGYGDDGTKYAYICYDCSSGVTTSERNSATVQLSVTGVTCNTIVYSGWQKASSTIPGTTGTLTYTLSLT